MWTETIRVMDQWFERLPSRNQDGQHIVDVSTSILETALMIISAAGFGRTIPWPDQDQELAAHHSLSWLDALKGVGTHLIVRGTLARFLFRLPIPNLRKVDKIFNEFEAHVLEMIDERRAMGQQGLEMNDLFSRLIRASDAEEGKARLSPDELIANIHIFLLAGHETTAHLLSSAREFRLSVCFFLIFK